MVKATIPWLILCGFTTLTARAQTGQVKEVPGLYFDRPTGQYFINDKASFSVRPIEDKKYLDRIEVSIDNGGYEAFDGKISFDREGFHIVRFKAVDPVLNWSPVESFRIYVDLSAPKSHVEWKGETYQKDGTLFVGPTTQIALTSYDNLSGVQETQWKVGQEGKVRAYNNLLNITKSGQYELYLRALDHVGNEEEWKSYPFTVDAEAPTSKALVKGNSFRLDNKLFIDKGSFISLDAEDKESGVKKIEYILNKGEIKNYKQGIAVSEKVTNLKYRAWDHVGNIEKWQEITVFLDTDAPELLSKEGGTFKKVAGKYYAKPGFKVKVALRDASSGPKVLYTDNGGAEEQTEKLFSFDKKGEYSFSVRGEDQVGNVSNTIQYSIIIDDQAPQSTLSSTQALVERDGVFMSSLPNRLEFSSQDEGVGVDYIELSFDKQKSYKINAPIDLATWQTPKRKIFYRSVDHLGNKEEWQEKTIHVRNQGPKVDLFVESGNLPQVPLSVLKERLEGRGSSQVRGVASEKEDKRQIAPKNKKSSKRRIYRRPSNKRTKKKGK